MIEYPSSLRSTMEQNLSSFSEFSIYPFLIDEKDDCFLTQFLSQQELMHEAYTFQSHQSTETKNYTQMSSGRCSGKSNTETNRVASKKKTSKKSSSNKPIPRKRNGKKDRHSKIHTARGPRDRRMRLSLQVARKFFDLQDMLGFDKASKTIEWLFLKSMVAIKELKENFSSVSPNNVSSTSGSEVVSEIGDFPDSLSKIKGIGRENKCRKLRVISRESRDEARARARERTRGKLMGKGLPKSGKTCYEKNPNGFDEIGVQSEETNPLLKRVAEIDGLENVFLADQTDSWNVLGSGGASVASLMNSDTRNSLC